MIKHSLHLPAALLLALSLGGCLAFGEVNTPPPAATDANNANNQANNGSNNANNGANNGENNTNNQVNNANLTTCDRTCAALYPCILFGLGLPPDTELPAAFDDLCERFCFEELTLGDIQCLETTSCEMLPNKRCGLSDAILAPVNETIEVCRNGCDLLADCTQNGDDPIDAGMCKLQCLQLNVMPTEEGEQLRALFQCAAEAEQVENACDTLAANCAERSFCEVACDNIDACGQLADLFTRQNCLDDCNAVDIGAPPSDAGYSLGYYECYEQEDETCQRDCPEADLCWIACEAAGSECGTFDLDLCVEQCTLNEENQAVTNCSNTTDNNCSMRLTCFENLSISACGCP